MIFYKSASDGKYREFDRVVGMTTYERLTQLLQAAGHEAAGTTATGDNPAANCDTLRNANVRVSAGRRGLAVVSAVHATARGR